MSGTASPISIDGLTNGDRYTVTVTASNRAGQGPASEPVGPVVVGAGPMFTQDSPPLSTVGGRTYSYVFTAMGAPAPTYTLHTGPSWLHINATTGAVTGTPPVATSSFAYSVVAANDAGTGALAQTYDVDVTPAWQASVVGYLTVAPHDTQGYYLGVAGGVWKLEVTQPTKATTRFAGTITIANGAFDNVEPIQLEPKDTYSVSGRTLTFSVSDFGDIDGLSFTTDGASTITFTLDINGQPATGKIYTVSDPAGPAVLPPRPTCTTASPLASW